MEDMIDGQTYARVCQCGMTFLANTLGQVRCYDCVRNEVCPPRITRTRILNTVPPRNSALAPQENETQHVPDNDPPRKMREGLTEVDAHRISATLNGYRIMDARMLNGNEMWIQLEGPELPPMYLSIDIGTDGSLIAMYPPTEDGE
jgi:hypothetical protein